MKFPAFIFILVFISSFVAYGQGKIKRTPPVKQELTVGVRDKTSRISRGEIALYPFIKKNLRMPTDDIEGRVIVSFFVEKSGEIANIKVVRGLRDDCDAEAVRIVKLMPNWKPSIQINGEVVRAQYYLPIIFEEPED